MPRVKKPPLSAGQRFESVRCSTNVVVLDPGGSTEAPSCGGLPMRPGRLISCSDPGRPGPESVQTVAGLIYWDEVTGMRLRCTNSGSGLLTLQGRVMVVLEPGAPRRRAFEVRGALG
jgi:hypothetical protein